MSEDVSEDSSESDVLDDGDVQVPDNDGVSESMDDGDMYSTPDRRQGTRLNYYVHKFLPASFTRIFF